MQTWVDGNTGDWLPQPPKEGLYDYQGVADYSRCLHFYRAVVSKIPLLNSGALDSASMCIGSIGLGSSARDRVSIVLAERSCEFVRALLQVSVRVFSTL